MKINDIVTQMPLPSKTTQVLPKKDKEKNGGALFKLELDKEKALASQKNK